MVKSGGCGGFGSMVKSGGCGGCGNMINGDGDGFGVGDMVENRTSHETNVGHSHIDSSPRESPTYISEAIAA